jgi:hypothetical protein
MEVGVMVLPSVAQRRLESVLILKVKKNCPTTIGKLF